jgi:hypothetical protein
MKRIILGLALSLGAGAAWADPIDENGIVAAATGDWNKDDRQDLVLLTRGDPDMDLRFFIQDEKQFLKPVAVARNKVWGNAGPDSMVGQEPDIKALPNGSIQVITRNDTIGRDRWSQTLTLAYRNSDFAVAGFTYSWYDTLNLDSIGNCDLNVLTGKGKASLPDGKGGFKDVKVSVAPAFVPIQEWSDESAVKTCGIER